MVEYLESKFLKKKKKKFFFFFFNNFFHSLDAKNSLNRILNNLDENNDNDNEKIYENTKTLKFILESPLFINLYNIQNSLKKLKLENNNNNNLLIEIKKNIDNITTTTTTIINDNDDDDDCYFKLIKLKRGDSTQTFGFTIILIHHPKIDSNETFLFVQDVDENSIAA